MQLTETHGVNLRCFAGGARDDSREATAEERARAWLDYFGYFGSYSIDAEKNAVTHHVEGSA
ncbi:MAG: lipocalin-like domain-containing protein, partial [Candidatus Acidiferrales bacterium]